MSQPAAISQKPLYASSSISETTQQIGIGSLEVEQPNNYCVESEKHHTEIDQRHFQEWTEGSVVEAAIAQLNIESVTAAEAAQRLGFPVKENGWWCRGVNWRNGTPMGSSFGQFKPNQPHEFSKEKKAKYLTAAGTEPDAIFLAMINKNYWTTAHANKSMRRRWTEGSKKAGAGLTVDGDQVCTLALTGVWNGLEKVGEKQYKLRPIVAEWVEPGTTHEIAFDSDYHHKPECLIAIREFGKALQKAGGKVYVNVWDTQFKGMDDFIAANGGEEWKKLSAEAIPFEEWQKIVKQLEKQFNKNQQLESKKSQNQFASILAKKYKPHLAWDTRLKQWKRYSTEIEGIWSTEPEEYVAKLVIDEVEASEQPYKADFIRGITYLLKSLLAVKHWDENDLVIPLRNGVFDPTTKELKPHCPSNYLTWCLPYDYDPLATCEPIQKWMLQTVGGHSDQVQILRAYLNAIVLGRTDLQQYLELLGPGGTGKSTLIRLAMALVGATNIHTTTLMKLEGSKFETACIHGKRLVVITDSERYAGHVSTLKALTGQDPLPYEQKFMQSTGGFIPKAMVIVAANETIQSGDYTSGLERRRLTINFKNQIAAERQRNLITVNQKQVSGEFLPYIPGLLNWVLDLSNEEVTSLLKNIKQSCPSLIEQKHEVLLDTNPIADWADMHLVLRANHRTAVGIARKSKDKDDPHIYQCVNSWLYANYCEYSEATGSRPVAQRRFSNLLSDLLVNQLKFKEVFKGRDREGAFFKGIALRRDDDEDLYLISGKPPSSDPPPLPPWCDGKNDSCDGNVTAETLAGDECDGCDGKFKKSAHEKTEFCLESDAALIETELNPSVLPSHSSLEMAEIIAGDESQQNEVTFIQEASSDDTGESLPSQMAEIIAGDESQQNEVTFTEETSSDDTEESLPSQMVEIIAGDELEDVTKIQWTQRDIDDVVETLSRVDNSEVTSLILTILKELNIPLDIKRVIWSKLPHDQAEKLLGKCSWETSSKSKLKPASNMFADDGLTHGYGCGDRVLVKEQKMEGTLKSYQGNGAWLVQLDNGTTTKLRFSKFKKLQS